MQFEAYLQSPKANPPFFYLLYLGFLCNEWVIKNRAIRKWLWDLMKCELFYIGGQCKHSGMCCKSLILVHEGTEVRTKTQFETKFLNKTGYRQFKPVYQSDGKTLSCLTCSWLTPDNKCAHYANRPRFCRQYPMSSFMQFDRIHTGCGYAITRKHFNPTIRHPILVKLIAQMEYPEVFDSASFEHLNVADTKL